jgi:TonB family protein
MRVLLGVALGLSLAGGALAETRYGAFVHTAEPSKAEIKAAFPPSALARKITGKVVLSCLIASNKTLTDCRADKETPAGEGFGAAALTLTGRYRLQETDELGQGVIGRRDQIKITFLAPGDTEPDWARKPSAGDMRAALPKLAQESGVPGRAVLVCGVTVEGLLKNCDVALERPAGYGFGAAALKLAEQFRMKPAMRGGRPVEDEVSVPVVFPAYANDAGAIAGLIRDPPWDSAPTAADLLAAFPAEAGDLADGQIVLRCGIAGNGALTACKAISEAPEGKGLAKAALGLAPRFKVRMSAAGSLDLTKYAIDVPIHFRNPAKPDGRVIDRPTWTEMINPAVMTSLYPAAAAKAAVKTGVGEINCAVDARGKFSDCKITREQPTDLGFGAAALAVAEIMAMNPWTKDGDPVDGLRFTLPVRFKWQEPAAAAQAAPPAKP